MSDVTHSTFPKHPCPKCGEEMWAGTAFHVCQTTYTGHMPNTERDLAFEKAFNMAQKEALVRTWESDTQFDRPRHYFDAGKKFGIAQRERELAGGVEIEWRAEGIGWDGYIGNRYIGHITSHYAVEDGIMHRSRNLDSLDSAKAEAAKQVNELRKLLNGG